MYAMRNLDDSVYIGSTKNGKRRQSEHRRAGRTPIAFWPSTAETDEDALHGLLKPHLVDHGNRSSYDSAVLDEWLYSLLARGIAAPDLEQARRCPRLPLAALKPGTIRPPVKSDGQLFLTDSLPTRERIAFASDVAYLSSVSDEWFTPRFLIEDARWILGEIVTDPASHFAANEVINAKYWYNRELSGLDRANPWIDTVWLNPPYGRGEEAAKAFVDRLIDEMEQGAVHKAITCLNVNSTTTQWFRPVWQHAVGHCVYLGRPDFWLPPELAAQREREGKDHGPSKGIILSYFGGNAARFNERMRQRGTLVQRVECL